MEYILNIELKKGVIKKLTVYKGINVAEVAYNFCKENDLDFSSLNNLVLQIEEILEKLEGKAPSKDKRIIDNNKSTINKVKYLNPSLSNSKLFPYELSIDNYSNYFSESKESNALYSCRSVKNSFTSKCNTIWNSKYIQNNITIGNFYIIKTIFCTIFRYGFYQVILVFYVGNLTEHNISHGGYTIGKRCNRLGKSGMAFFYDYFSFFGTFPTQYFCTFIT